MIVHWQSSNDSKRELAYVILFLKIDSVFFIALGSCTVILDFFFKRILINSIDLDPLISLLFSLNDRPRTVMRLFQIFPRFFSSKWIICLIWRSFVCCTAFKSSGFTPIFEENCIIVSRSFGKQEPPKPGPALRNDLPIRGSIPMQLATSSTFVPGIDWHNNEIWLMKLIFVARNELFAFFIISAVWGFVVMILIFWPYNFR